MANVGKYMNVRGEMKMFEDLKIGDQLEISLYSKTANAKVYLSKLDCILADKQLVAFMPVLSGQFVKLPIDERYHIAFLSRESKIIRFTATAVRYLRKEGFNFIQFKLLDDGEEVQKREFRRYSCAIPFNFKEKNKLELKSTIVKLDSLTLSGIIRDISGGGIKFVSNNDLEEDTIIYCRISLKDEVIDIDGRIVNKKLFPKAVYAHQYRVQFVGITQAVRDKIGQYIFGQQF